MKTTLEFRAPAMVTDVNTLLITNEEQEICFVFFYYAIMRIEDFFWLVINQEYIFLIFELDLYRVF